MPPSSEELADIKSKQYVLITRAGLSIPSSEMDSKTIFAKMLEQFDYHVKRVKLPQGLAKNTYYRTFRHLDETVTEKEMGSHYGGNLAPSKNSSTIKSAPTT